MMPFTHVKKKGASRETQYLYSADAKGLGSWQFCVQTQQTNTSPNTTL